MQHNGNQVPHAIACDSHKLRSSEVKYPTIDLEALAVVKELRVFDLYLYGRRFLVYSGQRPLVTSSTGKPNSLE